jgi:hypothetical protein
MLHENGSILITSVFERVVPDKMNGKKEKKYSIDRADYRKVASSAVNLWRIRKNKVVFFTLTFPFKATEEVANSCFSKYVENLKQNYELSNYIAVKERGEIGGKLHFHCLFDIPFKPIGKLNEAWNKTFRAYHAGSPNSVSFGERGKHNAIIRSQKRCVKYICKYISKAIGNKNEVFSKPCVFISREIISEPRELTAEEVIILTDTFDNLEFSHEYFSVISLHNKYFSKFDKTGTENYHKIDR